MPLVDDLWSAIDKKFHVMFEDALFFKVVKIVASAKVRSTRSRTTSRS